MMMIYDLEWRDLNLQVASQAVAAQQGEANTDYPVDPCSLT